MPDSPKPRRAIPTLLSIFLVAATIVFLGVMRVNSFFRRKMIKLSDLKFPVLAIRSSGSSPYATWDADTLCNISKTSRRIPVNGMVLIDSDFQMATLENVTYNKGDFAWIARALFPDVGFKYKFDLRKRDKSGLAAALESLMQCEGLGDDPADDPRIRQELARQTTMDGVLATLHFQKPEELAPATQPASTEPSPVNQEPLPRFRRGE